MFFVYVLSSKKDHRFYVGYTINLRKRVDLHNAGCVTSTRNRRPFELVYYEACVNREDALHREKYLKTTYGKRYIYNRLKHYLKIISKLNIMDLKSDKFCF
jgi:putative endonuclease